MGIFTRLFRGQEGEAEEGQSSEEELMDSGQAKPPDPSTESAPSATPAEPRPEAKPERQPDNDSDRDALLSPTPKLAGGLRVASRPRRNKQTNPPPNGETSGQTAAQAMEKKPARSARPPRGEPTTQVAVPPPAAKPADGLPNPVAGSKSKPVARPPSPPSARPPATPRPTAAAKTKPQGSGQVSQASSARPQGSAQSPARAQAPRPSRGTAKVVASAPVGKDRRRRSPISEAFDTLLEGGGDNSAAGVSSDSDRAEVQGVFDDLAAEHVEVVRNIMLELEIEDVVCSWIESSKPPLQSLRTMAAEMELEELCAAIDGFTAAIDAAVGSGQSTVSGERKAEVQARYQKLIELIPQAFALEGERDRREPIIVESLLRQVPGVEKITIDKLFGVGLNKLTALIRSNAGDIAATSGIDPRLAEEIAARFRDYRSAVPSAVAAQDAAAERAKLGELLEALRRHHRDYTEAAAGWSDEDRAKKRDARRAREEAFLHVRVALARLGETDSLTEIEKRPFDQRITAVEKLLEKEDHGRPHP